MFLGLVVFVVGVVFLLQNLGYISGSVWGFVWPIIIIAVGLSMILNRTKISKAKTKK